VMTVFELFVVVEPVQKCLEFNKSYIFILIEFQLDSI